MQSAALVKPFFDSLMEGNGYSLELELLEAPNGKEKEPDSFVAFTFTLLNKKKSQHISSFELHFANFLTVIKDQNQQLKSFGFLDDLAEKYTKEIYDYTKKMVIKLTPDWLKLNTIEVVAAAIKDILKVFLSFWELSPSGRMDFRLHVASASTKLAAAKQVEEIIKRIQSADAEQKSVVKVVDTASSVVSDLSLEPSKTPTPAPTPAPAPAPAPAPTPTAPMQISPSAKRKFEPEPEPEPEQSDRADPRGQDIGVVEEIKSVKPSSDAAIKSMLPKQPRQPSAQTPVAQTPFSTVNTDEFLVIEIANPNSLASYLPDPLPDPSDPIPKRLYRGFS